MLQTHKKGKNDIVLTNVKISFQMEDERNRLGLGEKILEFLLLELEREQALGPNPHVSMDAYDALPNSLIDSNVNLK